MQSLKDRFTIKNIIFVILILLVLKLIFELKNLALLIFASFVIAASLNPFVDKLQKYMKRGVATIVALFSFMAIILGAFLPLVLIMLEEISTLVLSIPKKIVVIQNFLANKTIFGVHLSNIIGDAQPLNSASTEILGNAVQTTLAASASVVGAIAIMFIIGMVVFYMLEDKDVMKNWFLSLFPQDIRDKVSEISKNITERVGGFVIAQCTSMVSVGLVTSVGLAILGVPYALALGLLAGILDIVPIVGPILAVGMAISVAYSKGWGIIIGVIVVNIIAQWVSNNFIRPLIFGKFMNLHPLVILLSFLVAAEFLDVWGVILAPAIAAVIAVLFDELYVKQINEPKAIPQNDVEQ